MIPLRRGITNFTDIRLIDKEITDDAYKGMEVGGPLYGGIDSAKINVGFWIRVPDFHLNETTL
jgi:hypothetical protein